MNIPERNSQFLSFFGTLQSEQRKHLGYWTFIAGRTQASVWRNETQLQCVNCGSKYDLTEKRCECGQPNCFLDNETLTAE